MKIMNNGNQRHPFPQAKVARVLTGGARPGRRRFPAKSSSPEAAVFPRKAPHCRDTHLRKPVGTEAAGSTKLNERMDHMNLNEAEVIVTTQYLIDISSDSCHDMTLGDFSDMDEFLCSCSERFPDEPAPEYRYVRWENIPDTLITREWLCPNFFEVRDALEQLEEDDTDCFLKWCGRYGYDLRNDNPYLLVAHYRNLFGESTTPVSWLPDTEDDCCTCSYIPEEWLGHGLLRQEIFGDDYD